MLILGECRIDAEQLFVAQHGRSLCGMVVDYFSLRSAVKPMPRRFGCRGFMSSRIAESMAAMGELFSRSRWSKECRQVTWSMSTALAALLGKDGSSISITKRLLRPRQTLVTFDLLPNLRGRPALSGWRLLTDRAQDPAGSSDSRGHVPAQGGQRHGDVYRGQERIGRR